MIQLHDQLEARDASVHDERDGKHLFVWGDVGQWLVIDSEAAALLKCFAKRRRVDEAIRAYSRQFGAAWEDTARDALPVVDALVQRGILGRSIELPPAPEESLRLSSLTYNITNRCNLTCPWCYNPRTKEEAIPVADFTAWLAAGAASLDDDATFFILGGEPLLDQPRLLDVIRGSRSHLAGEIVVSTNGTLLDDSTPRELADLKATVQVSLDSPVAAQHDAARGAGVFERAVDTARRLVDADVLTVLSMVMTRHSPEQFETYFDLAREIGADEVRFIPLRQIGGGADHADDAPDLYGCFVKLLEILRRRPELAQMLQRDFYSILMTVCRFSRLRSNCGIARRCLFVDANGDIFPCPNHRSPQCRCGNVRSLPLAKVFERSTVLGDLRVLYRMEKMPACRQCAFRFWCAGDCRAEALCATGEPGAPSPYCDQIQQTMIEMFWLLADGWQGLGRREVEIRPWS